MNERTTPPPMDFFNRIVVKARGAESPIAPRLPSLFEPLAGAGMAPTTDIEEQATPSSAHERQDARPASMVSRSPVLHEPRPLAHRPVETTGQGDEPEPRETDRPAHAADAEPVATLQPMPVVSRIVPSPVARPDEQPPKGKPEPGVMPANKTGRRRTQESDHEVSGARLKALHQGSGVLVPKLAAVPEPYPGAREAPRAGSPTIRDVAANTPVAEQPAPVVNVTIGRVEVRAVQASAGKPRIEPARPKPLSLDDYLKQRGGN